MPSLQTYLGTYGSLTKEDARAYKEEMQNIEEEFKKLLEKKQNK